MKIDHNGEHIREYEFDYHFDGGTMHWATSISEKNFGYYVKQILDYKIKEELWDICNDLNIEFDVLKSEEDLREDIFGRAKADKLLMYNLFCYFDDEEEIEPIVKDEEESEAFEEYNANEID